MLGEEVRFELYKNAACCFENILEAKPPPKSSFIATFLPSHKPSKKDEQGILGTVGEG